MAGAADEVERGGDCGDHFGVGMTVCRRFLARVLGMEEAAILLSTSSRWPIGGDDGGPLCGFIEN